jgi:hypothetical protein
MAVASEKFINYDDEVELGFFVFSDYLLGYCQKIIELRFCYDEPRLNRPAIYGLH